MRKIFIVEDEKNISDLIQYTLDNMRDTTGAKEFESYAFDKGAKMFEALKEGTTPDIILLDIMLPDEDGISILKKMKLKNDWKNIPVIFLTAKSSEVDKIKGLNLGADDYVTKPFSIMELIARINAVLRRNSKEDLSGNKVFKYESIEIDVKKHIAKVGGEVINLTRKEFELLFMLIENESMVLTREVILEKIWGYDFEGESRTIDMHVTTLRKKLGECGKYIKTVRGIGYKLGD